jgi:hypothetical protein
MASTHRLNKPSGNPPALRATNPPLAVQAMLRVTIERALWYLVNVSVSTVARRSRSQLTDHGDELSEVGPRWDCHGEIGVIVNVTFLEPYFPLRTVFA